jgi:hypothetical protein
LATPPVAERAAGCGRPGTMKVMSLFVLPLAMDAPGRFRRRRLRRYRNRTRAPVRG